jgi:hypothetical protein
VAVTSFSAASVLVDCVDMDVLDRRQGVDVGAKIVPRSACHCGDRLESIGCEGGVEPQVLTVLRLVDPPRPAPRRWLPQRPHRQLLKEVEMLPFASV